MKKRLIAAVLSLVLTLSMSFTALAASSTTTDNSGSQEETTTSDPEPAPTVATPSNPKPVDAVVAETKAGETIEAAAIQVAVVQNGTATPVTLDKVVEEQEQKVVNTVANIQAIVAVPAVSAEAQASQAAQVVAQVSQLLTQAPTPQFQATVQALAEQKGADVAVNNMGTVKTAAVVTDDSGNTIASAGVVRHVTKDALIMLMSVNEDGTIEYVEGVVDPVTGQVVGIFTGRPAVITVLVLA